KAGRQSQALGSSRGNEAGECRHPVGVERIQSTAERVIIAMARLHAWGNEARDGLMVEKMGHEVELLIEKAQAVKDHGCDRMAYSHNPHCRVLLGRSINDFRAAEFFKHPRDQAPVISDLGTVRVGRWRDIRAVRVSHSLLLCRGIVSAPKNDSMTREWCGIAGQPHGSQGGILQEANAFGKARG